MAQSYVVRCRGLPWSCTEEDLRVFFGVAAESMVKVVLTKTKEGRASGEAYVQFSDEKGYGIAMSKDRETLGNRYVEVFPSTSAEMEQPRGYGGSRPPPGGGSSFVSPLGASVVRLRGLPYGCTKEEIIRFFDGLNIVPNGVVLPFEITGRGKGEAYVVFADAESGTRALERNKQNIQHRYIEVFPSNQNDMEWAIKTPNDMPSRYAGGYGGSGYGGYGEAPRGLMDDPYSSQSQARNAAWGYSDPQGTTYAHESWSPAANTGGYASYGAHSQPGWDYSSPPIWDRNGPAPAMGGYDSGYSREVGGPMRPRRGNGMSNAWGADARMTRSPYAMPSPAAPMMSSSLSIRMRGLPYQATVQDIIDFFNPIRPAKIDILKEKTGRPSGEAIVDFYSKAELDDALSFDRRNMANRYIELFPEGSQPRTQRRY
uniref:RRM domain-containing protein n=2 Tax=Steinernema glaseri TaxID=37863 RepID=A0A1I7ZW69_9BILA